MTRITKQCAYVFICITTPLFAALKVGDATTVEPVDGPALVSTTIADLQRGTVMRTQDEAAFRKFLAAGRARELQLGDKVFIVTYPRGDFAEIRLQGHVDSLWIAKESLSDYEWRRPPRLQEPFNGFEAFAEALARFAKKVQERQYARSDFDVLLAAIRGVEKPTSGDYSVQQILDKYKDVLQRSGDLYVVYRLSSIEPDPDQELVNKMEQDFLDAAERFLIALRSVDTGRQPTSRRSGN